MQSSHTLEQFRHGIDKQIGITNMHFVITTVDKASTNFAFICKIIASFKQCCPLGSSYLVGRVLSIGL